MKLTEKTTRRLKPKKALVSSKETNKIVVCLFLLALWNGLMIISLLILLANNNKLAGKRTVFVQETTGNTIVAQEKNKDYRSEEVIRSTISRWLPMMWEWNSEIPGTQTIDEGMSMGVGRDKVKVPTRVYIGSYLLDPTLRWEYLKAIAEEIPKEFYREKIRSVFEIKYLGKPVREGNSYKIDVIASRTDINQTTQEKRASKFHKTIVLKAVEPYKSVDAETSAFNKQLEILLQGGLTIIEVRNLELDRKTNISS